MLAVYYKFKSKRNFLFIVFVCLNLIRMYSFATNLVGERAFGVWAGATTVLSLLIYNWIYYLELAAWEILPKGINPLLSLYLVLLELIRALRKGLTLGLRLSANLIAGKLLGALCVIGSSWPLLSSFFFIIERFVGFIQAFIIVLLATLYWTDFLLR